MYMLILLKLAETITNMVTPPSTVEACQCVVSVTRSRTQMTTHVTKNCQTTTYTAKATTLPSPENTRVATTTKKLTKLWQRILGRKRASR